MKFITNNKLKEGDLVSLEYQGWKKGQNICSIDQISNKNIYITLMWIKKLEKHKILDIMDIMTGYQHKTARCPVGSQFIIRKQNLKRMPCFHKLDDTEAVLTLLQ